MSKAVVYYDGLCPLCRKEINWLKGYRQDLVWQDVHQQTELESDPLLRNLHVKLASGQWLVGLPANVYLWRGTPMGAAAWILSLPLIRAVGAKAYQFWAKRRYEKRYRCGNHCFGGE